MGYPLQLIYEEVAFIAYHFHWPRGDVMELEHEERRKWVEEISEINKKINESAEKGREEY